MSDESKPREFRVYKPQFDQGYAKCTLHRPPYATYDLDPNYWDSFYEFIEKSAYDALLKENENLKVYKDQVWSYVQGTGNTSPKTLGFHVAEALVMDHKDLKKERDRALAMLKRMAGALDSCETRLLYFETMPKELGGGEGSAMVEHAKAGRVKATEVLAEYRREFGGEGNEKET